MTFNIAQMNVAKAIAGLDTPVMAEFVRNLEPINALAEQAPGFVWRLKDETGDATNIKLSDDPMFIINMSVWRGIDDLFNYVYKTAHATFLARRKEWFEKMGRVYSVLWWVPDGTYPTPEEGMKRLELLERVGPSAAAFTFKRRSPLPQDVAD